MILETLCKQQDKWESMVKAMRCPNHLILDVVQDMYIKVSGLKNTARLMYNETEVNHFYIYMVLRSVFCDTMSRENKYIKPDEVDSNVINYDFNTEEDEAWERLYGMIQKEINSFGPYGAKLCFTYFKTDKSLRQIANESGISVTSIFHSQKQYREHLYNKFEEDYQDLKNGDYRKI